MLKRKFVLLHGNNIYVVHFTYMSFNIAELHEIISVVGDVVFMRDGESSITIQTGVEFVAHQDDDMSGDESYFEISFPVKHGKVDIKIWDATGEIMYTVTDASKPLLKVCFDDTEVDERSGSFYLALKEVLKSDRNYKSPFMAFSAST